VHSALHFLRNVLTGQLTREVDECPIGSRKALTIRTILEMALDEILEE
jgi:hypothetical protein